MTSYIYLDNSTTTAPSQKAISAMMPYFTHHWGVPSAPHQKGQELFSSLPRLYQELYSFIGANEEDTFIFTSSGTEAINHVISSVYRDITLTTGKNHFLSGKTDEAASIMSISHLEPFGCLGGMIELNNAGIITTKEVIEALSPRTALVSISWANGLTGTIQPVAEIGELCRKRGVLFHVDASHVLGKLFFNLKDINPDFLSFNGDQFHAPKGTGGLYIRHGLRCSPFLFGSADQGGMRGGEPNMAALAGLAMAAREAIDSRDLLCTETARLRNEFENGILKGYPEGIICFKTQERLPHCTTLLFPGIANEALLFALNRRGLYASIGGGNFQQLSGVLASAGIKKSMAQCGISFSLSRSTTEEEIERAIAIVVESAHTLRKLSPFKH